MLHTAVAQCWLKFNLRQIALAHAHKRSRDYRKISVVESAQALPTLKAQSLWFECPSGRGSAALVAGERPSVARRRARMKSRPVPDLTIPSSAPGGSVIISPDNCPGSCQLNYTTATNNSVTLTKALLQWFLSILISSHHHPELKTRQDGNLADPSFVFF